MKRLRKIELLPQLVESLVADQADVILIFADLCGSTRYKQNLMVQGHPDVNWILRQVIFLQRSAALIRQYKGTVVKTIGDEVFGYFEATTDPQEVLRCAIAMIQSFENLQTYTGKSAIETKVSVDLGLTYNGSVTRGAGYDPIGTAVDRCARLNGKAANNEVLISNDFYLAAQQRVPVANLKKNFGLSPKTFDLKGFGKTKCYRICAK